MLSYLLRAFVYLMSFAVSWYAMQAVDYERFLKKGHVQQAQVLYFVIVIALACLMAQFFTALIYNL